MAGKRDALRAEVLEKKFKALELRKKGYSFRQIAKHLNVSHVQVGNYINSALESLAKNNEYQTVELRQLELERLDNLTLKLLPKIKLGDIAAINTAIKISERRAKLLGLDAATQVDVVDNRQLDLLVRELQSRGLSPADVFESLIAELAHANRADSRP